MDVEEFKGRVKPAARRSRLAPYRDAISQLRADGYTLNQVREFLAINGVDITVAGISR